jgi:hypothetical protein
LRDARPFKEQAAAWERFDQKLREMGVKSPTEPLHPQEHAKGEGKGASSIEGLPAVNGAGGATLKTLANGPRLSFASCRSMWRATRTRDFFLLRVELLLGTFVT